MSKSADEDLRLRRDRAFGSGAALFYQDPLHIVRGEGASLFDADGRRYIDMYNNVPCVGHGNRRVAEAVARQQATLNVHSRYLHEGAIELAERLANLHGRKIETVLFSCSGTEAIEIALRMARFATGRRGVICTNATYHGNSDLVSRLTRIGQTASVTEEIRAIPFPETYRPLVACASGTELCEAYLNELKQAIKSLEDSGAGLAAFIVCSIFANEGLPDVPEGFMARAEALVRAAGGLVISDEVQAGYARTGSWWGYDVSGFTPDIAVTGKPMANGLPLAATAASRSVMENFRTRTRYFNTCAASPVQAAAGLAVLDEIEALALHEHVRSLGASIKEALNTRAANWDAIGDVRGRGLFLGVEMIKPGVGKVPDPEMAVTMVNRLKQKGVLTSNAGAFSNVIKIRPPLVLNQAEAEAFLDAFDASIAELKAEAVTR